MAEQGQGTQKVPDFTIQMAEAGFSLNVKMIDPHGQEVMLTFRAPLLNHATTLLDHYESQVKRLMANGWQPLTNSARVQSNAQSAPTGDVPICRVHGAPMKPSRKPGSFFCSKKLANGEYCAEKVG